MRVAAVSATGLVSGAERVLIRYARCALDAGLEFDVAAPVGPLIDELRRGGVPAVELPDLKLGLGSRAPETVRLAGRHARSLPRLRRFVADADLVLVNSIMALPPVVAVAPAAPVCWLVHDVVRRRDLRALTRAAGPRVSVAIAVSEAAAARPRALGIDTVVVPNGVVFPSEPAQPSGQPPIVGLNAVLTPWKGQDCFLEAVSRIDVPLLAQLLGGALPKDGAFEHQLRRRAAQPDLSSRVEFLGHSPEPLSAMRAWSIAVSASRDPEAGPLAITEAMSLGLPVIVTDHGGGPELVGDCGLRVPPDDPGGMAEAIEQYLADPERRRRDGAAGRRRVSERYRIDDACRRFLDVLSDTVAGRIGEQES